MIVADTGAVVALLDEAEEQHSALVSVFVQDPSRWVLPWSVLPEVDYLASKYLGAEVATAFLGDLVKGHWRVDWGDPADLERALEIQLKYADLEIGLTDSVVMATSERLQAEAVATLDLRDFGPVELIGAPRLIPRDL